MIVVVYDTASGKALTVRSELPKRLPDGAAVYTVAQPFAALATLQWDRARRELVERTPPQRMVLSLAEFTRRYTLAERIELEVAKESAAPRVRATLRVIDADLAFDGNVQVTDTRVRRGVEYAVDVLVTAGLVDAADRDARIAALLAPSTTGR